MSLSLQIPEKTFLSLAEVVAVLKISLADLKLIIAAGLIPVDGSGPELRIRRRDLLAFALQLSASLGPGEAGFEDGLRRLLQGLKPASSARASIGGKAAPPVDSKPRPSKKPKKPRGRRSSRSKDHRGKTAEAPDTGLDLGRTATRSGAGGGREPAIHRPTIAPKLPEPAPEVSAPPPGRASGFGSYPGPDVLRSSVAASDRFEAPEEPSPIIEAPLPIDDELETFDLDFDDRSDAPASYGQAAPEVLARGSFAPHAAAAADPFAPASDPFNAPSGADPFAPPEPSPDIPPSVIQNIGRALDKSLTPSGNLAPATKGQQSRGPTRRSTTAASEIVEEGEAAGDDGDDDEISDLLSVHDSAEDRSDDYKRLLRVSERKPTYLGADAPASARRSSKKKRKATARKTMAEPKREAERPDLSRAGASRRQVEIEEVQRRTTVRYYKQMYLGKNYPLFVIISQHKIKKIVDVLVGQASSKKAFNIKKSNPIVHIRPIFPGCLCVPPSQDLDVTERIAESKFWLTPNAVGALDGAKVEILYEGKVVDTIPITAVATTQGMAKVSGSLAFVTTTFGPTFKSIGEELTNSGAEWAGGLFSLAGSSSGPYLTSAALAILTGLFYLWNKPKQAPDLEAFFDYEAAQGPPGDPQVIAQRCRLVLLSRSQRHIFEIGELLTTFGKASDRLIRLTERGIENQHCALRFDPDRQVFSIEAGRGPVEVDGVAVEANQDLRRDAVLKLGNEVSLWFFDERSDEAGLDNPTKRHQAQQILERELASFVPKIRAAFADPKHKTVRRVVAALMVEGILTPQHWSRLRRASGL